MKNGYTIGAKDFSAVLAEFKGVIFRWVVQIIISIIVFFKPIPQNFRRTS